jgi:uncharacterized protein YbjT (DUF2867 family)
VSNKIAIVLGASGLVGHNLLSRLLLDPDFSKVKIFVRASTGIFHAKLEEIVVDFNRHNTFKDLIVGDVLFSCMGTTLRVAGSKDNQYRVDFTYQYQVAQYASENNVPAYVLVSSTGANSKSKIFYSRIKGQLEDEIKKLKFQKIIIAQPSILYGERKINRPMEKIFAKLMLFFSYLIPFTRKYRSISGDMVAKALIHYYKKEINNKINTYKLDQLFVS